MYRFDSGKRSTHSRAMNAVISAGTTITGWKLAAISSAVCGSRCPARKHSTVSATSASICPSSEATSRDTRRISR